MLQLSEAATQTEVQRLTVRKELTAFQSLLTHQVSFGDLARSWALLHSSVFPARVNQLLDLKESVS